MQLYSSNIIETDNTEKAVETVLKYFEIKSILNNPDVKILETPKGKTKIPIEETKKLREWISIKPYQQKVKLIIVKDAQYLGADSQNTLLKTLEEPPTYAIIVLLTNSIKSLLDTVISRCKIIKFENTNIEKDEQPRILLKKIIDNNLAYSLDLIENITKDIEGKGEAVSIVNNLQLQLRELKNDIDPELFSKLQNVKADLETTNINVKIALYKLILDLKV